MRTTRLKHALAAVWVLPLAIGFAGTALPADTSTNGKELYKQNCRLCHTKDSPSGDYTPMSLIQDQWKRFFKEKLVPTHKDLIVPGRSMKLLESLTPDELKAIEKFCVDHAADSEQPSTCS